MMPSNVPYRLPTTAQGGGVQRPGMAASPVGGPGSHLARNLSSGKLSPAYPNVPVGNAMMRPGGTAPIMAPPPLSRQGQTLQHQQQQRHQQHQGTGLGNGEAGPPLSLTSMAGGLSMTSSGRRSAPLTAPPLTRPMSSSLKHQQQGTPSPQTPTTQQPPSQEVLEQIQKDAQTAAAMIALQNAQQAVVARQQQQQHHYPPQTSQVLGAAKSSSSHGMKSGVSATASKGASSSFMLGGTGPGTGDVKKEKTLAGPSHSTESPSRSLRRKK